MTAGLCCRCCRDNKKLKHHNHDDSDKPPGVEIGDHQQPFYESIRIDEPHGVQNNQQSKEPSQMPFYESIKAAGSNDTCAPTVHLREPQTLFYESIEIAQDTDAVQRSQRSHKKELQSMHQIISRQDDSSFAEATPAPSPGLNTNHTTPTPPKESCICSVNPCYSILESQGCSANVAYGVIKGQES